jgi:guanylate kinase
MRRGNLFIVSGPSGAGKGTLVKEMLGRVPDVWVSVSVTTRPPRPSEHEGREYFFLTDEQFDALLTAGGLLEWAEVHGNRYGTPRAEVEARVAQGRQVILEIDPQGAMQVKKLRPESVLVFVTAPSMAELRRRLEARGSETEEQVRLRLTNAERELLFAEEYGHVVINDDIARAADELATIIDTQADRPIDENRRKR